jgi:type IV pilus assembly protein PilC
MEFRCRLASPSGEITEGVYIAENEARLRHELEEKGLYVLSLQPKGLIRGVSLQLPQRRAINTREFLVFNQELATLLKAGMPLVQSLDILRQRIVNPTFKAVVDQIYERVRPERRYPTHSPSTPRCSRRSMPPRCLPANGAATSTR